MGESVESCVLALSAPLLRGLPVQQIDNLRPITTGTKLDTNFCAFHGAVKVSQDVLHVYSINLPPVHCDFVSSPSHSYKPYDRIHTIRFTRYVTVRAIATVNNCETRASRRGWPSPNSCFARFNGKVILISTVATQRFQSVMGQKEVLAMYIKYIY